jgi:hypothetical protein
VHWSQVRPAVPPLAADAAAATATANAAAKRAIVIPLTTRYDAQPAERLARTMRLRARADVDTSLDARDSSRTDMAGV